MLNPNQCVLLAFGLGVVSAFAAYAIPDMRGWFMVWAVAWPLVGAGLLWYSRR